MKFELKKHPSFARGIQCRINFDNGCGISIINGRGAYCDNETFEIAPLFDDELEWIESWNEQVKGYVTAEEISEITEFAEKAKSKEEYMEFLSNFKFENNHIRSIEELLDSIIQGMS